MRKFLPGKISVNFGQVKCDVAGKIRKIKKKYFKMLSAEIVTQHGKR